MKRKSLTVLILAICMCLSLPLLSYADIVLTEDQSHSNCPLKIFGQEIVETGNGFPGGMRVIVIVAGADRIEESDLQIGNGTITKK